MKAYKLTRTLWHLGFDKVFSRGRIITEEELGELIIENLLSEAISEEDKQLILENILTPETVEKMVKSITKKLQRRGHVVAINGE